MGAMEKTLKDWSWYHKSLALECSKCHFHFQKLTCGLCEGCHLETSKEEHKHG